MSVTLSAAELNSMAAALAETRSGSATIKRPVLADDGAGGQTETESTVVQGISCHVTMIPYRNAEEVELADKVRGVSYWKVSLPKDADIRIKDRIVVGTISYEVVAFDTPQTIQLETNVICKLIIG